MRINPIQTYTFRKNDNYYEYGNQKFLKRQEKKNEVKTAFVLAFGLACLVVGVFSRRRII